MLLHKIFSKCCTGASIEIVGYVQARSYFSCTVRPRRRPWQGGAEVKAAQTPAFSSALTLKTSKKMNPKFTFPLSVSANYLSHANNVFVQVLP